jgi:phosphate-selective porin OprO/OprP
MFSHSMFRLALFASLAGFTAPSGLWAQAVQGIPADPGSAYDQAADPKAEEHYAIPDVPKKLLDWTAYQGKYFSYKVGIVAILDYDAFWQNPDNIAQVGAQRDQWDIRSFRVAVGGKFGSRFAVKYFVSAEYKGLDRPANSQGWGSTDVALTVPLGPPDNGSITIGKIKETFSYEMAGDAANIPQMERLLNPFFTSRNVGVRYQNNLANKRIFISGGWFNDWWTKGNPYSGSSNHYTMRITGLPYMSSDKSKYLHAAFAARWIGAANGQLQYVARPESNVTTPYVDTGKFAARSATNYGFEALANDGPVSLLAEYIYTVTDAPAAANPHFYGTYVTGSWIITGEHHPYDPSVGYARRIIPAHRYGAWEVVGRVGRVDLNSRAIAGGALNAYSANVSWWPNMRYRVSADYGFYPLYRAGLTGTTSQFHARLQWVY